MKKLTALIVLLFGLIININAQQLDKKIVSLYVVNFTKHILWPNFNSPTFVIGVAGSQVDVMELSKLAINKKVNDKQIVVKHITETNISDIKDCQILLIKENSSQIISQNSAINHNSPLLIVAEKKSLIKKGASISLFLDEDDEFKTKFQLNTTKLEQIGLKVSSELVALSSK